MIHGAGAVAQIQHGGQAAGNVGLGPLHRGVQIAAFGQIGGNGAGQGAAGAVGVGVGDAFAVEPFAGAAAPQQVVGVVHAAQPLHEQPVDSVAVAVEKVFEGRIVAFEHQFHQPPVLGDDIVGYLHTRSSLRISITLSAKAQSGLSRS